MGLYLYKTTDKDTEYDEYELFDKENIENDTFIDNEIEDEIEDENTDVSLTNETPTLTAYNKEIKKKTKKNTVTKKRHKK
jgi:hypothetical protein